MKTWRICDSKLPKYPDPELEHTRNVALETDLREVLGNAQAQGHSPSAAASLLLQQAEEYDRTLPQAESCIRESAAGDADRIIAQLQDGTYDLSAGGIPGSCAKYYINMYYGAVANREMAVGLACMANSQL